MQNRLKELPFHAQLIVRGAILNMMLLGTTIKKVISVVIYAVPYYRSKYLFNNVDEDLCVIVFSCDFYK